MYTLLTLTVSNVTSRTYGYPQPSAGNCYPGAEYINWKHRSIAGYKSAQTSWIISVKIRIDQVGVLILKELGAARAV